MAQNVFEASELRGTWFLIPHHLIRQERVVGDPTTQGRPCPNMAGRVHVIVLGRAGDQGLASGSSLGPQDDALEGAEQSPPTVLFQTSETQDLLQRCPETLSALGQALHRLSRGRGGYEPPARQTCMPALLVRGPRPPVPQLAFLVERLPEGVSGHLEHDDIVLK
eukprot:3599674-Lingulodinium_polyedra.AAC.1